MRAKPTNPLIAQNLTGPPPTTIMYNTMIELPPGCSIHVDNHRVFIDHGHSISPVVVYPTDYRVQLVRWTDKHPSSPRYRVPSMPVLTDTVTTLNNPDAVPLPTVGKPSRMSYIRGYEDVPGLSATEEYQLSVRLPSYTLELHIHNARYRLNGMPGFVLKTPLTKPSGMTYTLENTMRSANW